MKDVTRVAVGVISNSKDEILIALRPKHSHCGGLWEFPGGKIEAGESTQQALSRELYEELGITIGNIQTFLNLTHQYPDKQVELDIHLVPEFEGQPIGREGQLIRWVKRECLEDFDFPEANQAIVEKLLF